VGRVHLCRVAGDIVRSHMAGDALQLSDGFSSRATRTH